jgi:hypothetical protein
MSTNLRPRAAAGLGPPSPHIEPDTPAAHYVDSFDEDFKAANAAHVHEHAQQPETPRRGWRRMGGRLGELERWAGGRRGEERVSGGEM